MFDLHSQRCLNTMAIQQIRGGANQGMGVIGSISNQSTGLPLPFLDFDAVNPKYDQLFSTFRMLLTRDYNTRLKLCRTAACQRGY